MSHVTPTHESYHDRPVASPPLHRTRTSSPLPRPRTRRTSRSSSKAHLPRLSPRRPACTSSPLSASRLRRPPPHWNARLADYLLHILVFVVVAHKKLAWTPTSVGAKIFFFLRGYPHYSTGEAEGPHQPDGVGRYFDNRDQSIREARCASIWYIFVTNG